jgi:hypothetical protein
VFFGWLRRAEVSRHCHNRPGFSFKEALMSPAPGAKADPITQRGLKVIHIGFQQSAFHNRGESGRVEVRFVDAAGKYRPTLTQLGDPEVPGRQRRLGGRGPGRSGLFFRHRCRRNCVTMGHDR